MKKTHTLWKFSWVTSGGKCCLSLILYFLKRNYWNENYGCRLRDRYSLYGTNEKKSQPVKSDKTRLAWNNFINISNRRLEEKEQISSETTAKTAIFIPFYETELYNQILSPKSNFPRLQISMIIISRCIYFIYYLCCYCRQRVKGTRMERC